VAGLSTGRLGEAIPAPGLPVEKKAQSDDRSLNPEPAWPLIITRN
jgi:hypothetical protein